MITMHNVGWKTLTITSRTWHPKGRVKPQDIDIYIGRKYIVHCIFSFIPCRWQHLDYTKTLKLLVWQVFQQNGFIKYDNSQRRLKSTLIHNRNPSKNSTGIWITNHWINIQLSSPNTIATTFSTYKPVDTDQMIIYYTLLTTYPIFNIKRIRDNLT